ncbi:MAG: aldose epimerase family protein [Bacteroidota bacterium]
MKNWRTKVNGKMTDLFVLKNKNGIEAYITNFGGIITSLIVPDKEGNLEDIVLGYDSIEETINGNPYFGAIIGRYGNRIAKGKFSINGNEYTLAINNGPNALHGGIVGYNAVVWDAEQEGNKLILKHLDPDMHEGYPGNVEVVVTYELTDENELKITYDAITDKSTVVNLTSHSFFNLKGAGNGTANDHLLMINAEKYTPSDENLAPTGEIRNVKGTPFDFTEFKEIGKDLEVEDQDLKNGMGYDHNFVLNGKENEMKYVAKVIEQKSGRVMEMWTTEPGVQFYGAYWLDGSDIGKGGKAYHSRDAFCLETQHYPDSPNNDHFPSTLLNPGEKYHTETIHKFSIQ